MWIDIAVIVVRAILPFVVMLTAVPALIWLERRLVAWMQARLGPNRVGPQGLFQPVADILKLLFKEDYRPAAADWLVFAAAPAFAVMTSFMAFAPIPIGAPLVIAGHRVVPAGADIEVGLLYITAVLSLGVYAVVLGGWASDSKYSLLGGMRSAAQMISYELSLGLSLVAVAIVAGSLRPSFIVQAQTIWYGVPLLLAAVTFFIASLAETNRSPFDLPEAEQELVSGFNTEYSALRFGLFFLAEYANLVTASALFTTCFLGGWSGPLFGPLWLRVILPFVWFLAKVSVLIFTYMWIRATMPRFRYDQLMFIGWKILLPVTGLNVLLVAAAVSIAPPRAGQPLASGFWLALFVSQVILLAASYLVGKGMFLRRFGGRPRQAVLVKVQAGSIPTPPGPPSLGGSGGTAPTPLAPLPWREGGVNGLSSGGPPPGRAVPLSPAGRGAGGEAPLSAGAGGDPPHVP
jgi:NADH-quinone oxidoreductase subunit H